MNTFIVGLLMYTDSIAPPAVSEDDLRMMLNLRRDLVLPGDFQSERNSDGSFEVKRIPRSMELFILFSESDMRKHI